MDKNNQCHELNSIQYKTMMNGGSIISKNSSKNTSEAIEKYLDIERNKKHNESWNRLDKCTRNQKLIEYAERTGEEKHYSDIEKNNLEKTLLSYLDKKMLQRAKDVLYDKDKGLIINIPNLEYCNNSKRFTLKKSIKTVTNKISATKPRAKTKKRNDKIDSSNKE
tara:strand:- start:287 stop:781 length:495 start_codon:yes stop_codon:yes gene_type:complete